MTPTESKGPGVEPTPGTVAASAEANYTPEGYSVFPIKFALDNGKWEKKPLVPWREQSRPRAEWGRRHAQAMGWGVDCGKSGLVVVDEDEPGAMAAALGYEPDTYTVRTGKGRHFYFRAPAGVRFKNSVRAVAGLDVRADGGYVVGPGAKRPDGREYVVERAVPVSAMTPALIALLPKKPEPTAAQRGEPVRVRDRGAYCRAALENTLALLEDFGVGEGHRNDTLNTAALQLGHLVGDPAEGYLDEAEVRERLREWGLSVGLKPDGVAATIDSGLGKGMAEPYELVEDESLPSEGDVSVSHPDVQRELNALRVRHAARQAFEAEQRGSRALERPGLVGLGSFLAVPDEPVRYLVEDLWPSGGRIVLAAQNKAGKTTLTGNLVRCLADGDLFLGRFAVQPVRRVVLIDDEMSEQQLRSWLRAQDVQNPEVVEVVLLRGRASTFDILNADVRSEWARAIGPADVVLFDCLRPALDALGLDENHDTGRFLEALDALMAEAGAGALGVVHHMGHSNERSRGDSRLEDWPDAKWRLVREDPEQDDSPRFFKAYGRDVDQAEVRLHMDAETRHLSIDGGSRAQHTGAAIQGEVLDCVRQQPGITQNKIESALGHTREAVRKAIRQMIANGVLRVEAGPNRANHHYLDDGEDLL